jgi:cytoskeletal protein CcmA (bactofilin family)
MAFGRKGTDSQPSTGIGADLGALTAFIDQGSSFEGRLSFKDTVRIDGHFSGQISSENTLVVGETGVIEADVHSEIVIVSGTVAGDIVAGKKIVMHKTGRIDGNVQTPSLMMEEGAVLNGQVKMSDKRPSLSAAPSASASAQSSSSGS